MNAQEVCITGMALIFVFSVLSSSGVFRWLNTKLNGDNKL